MVALNLKDVGIYPCRDWKGGHGDKRGYFRWGNEEDKGLGGENSGHITSSFG